MEIKMEDTEKKRHEAILEFGWDAWKERKYLGQDDYHSFMKELNPFAKSYFCLLERYECATKLLEKCCKERNHYKERYLLIAQQATDSLACFAQAGADVKR